MKAPRASSTTIRRSAGRRSQRILILSTLEAVCSKIEQLQGSDQARLACRDVIQLLARERLKEEAIEHSKTL